MSVSIGLFAVLAMQAATPDWRVLDTNSVRQMSWDANGVERDGETRMVSIRFVHIPARQGANAHAISRVEIRCTAGLVRVVETVNYAADGTAGHRDVSNTSLAAIPAESFVNTVRVQVCASPPAAR